MGQSRSEGATLLRLEFADIPKSMSASIRDTPKSRGRPSTGGRGVGVMVRLQPEQLAALDAWIARCDPPPSRPEAIRAILAERFG